jgi:recombinational DNA repair protein RecT
VKVYGGKKMNVFDKMDKIKTDFEEVISKLHNHDEENMAINIIIDDSDPQNPIFVEVENDSGESINIGEDSTTADGYRKLRINTSAIINHEKI